MKASSSDNPAPAKCLSGILRSLLCTGSLPTHPSDQFNIVPNTTQIDRGNRENSSQSEADHHAIKLADASLKPGVVARLMGLDSLPASPLPCRHKTLGSYFRSRSVNSIDFVSQFDPVQQTSHRRHRRVRTSVSFREEVPSLFMLDDKFSVVFPLEEVDETTECERKTSVINEKGKMEKRARGKSRNGGRFEERTVNKKLPARKMESGEGRRSVCAKFQSGSATPKKDFNGRTSANLRERRVVMNKPAMDSREKSPTMKQVKKKKVHGVEKIHPEPTGRGEGSHEICSNKQYSSSIKSSSSLVKNGEIRAITKRKTHEKKARNECTNMFEQVFRLTQESVDEINCEWRIDPIMKLEDFEDICVRLGRQILEVLLLQMVDELVLLYGTRIN